MQPRRLAYIPLLANDKYRFNDDQFAVKFTNAAETVIPAEAHPDPLGTLLTAHLRPGFDANALHQ
ncbi:hypothetical protein [Cupriavidus metallidurans]|uniref:hypothetical protein n=1 Tax=Cupriavidus metallidurans TaxID=119219 RepID=UPI001CCD2DF4|nr:hypothetical protein [Cupriavidus metallidurans]UBM12787.1 hypothetical protein LAI70_27935 [Cupriavidus metallidurans]